jgi:malonyl-CoA decarboxylase
MSSLFHEIGDRLDLSEKSSRSILKKADYKIVKTINHPNSFQKVSTATLTSEFCRSYLSLPHVSVSALCDDITTDKRQFLDLLLNGNCGIDESALASTINNVICHRQDVGSEEHPSIPNNSIRRIRELCTPRYQRIFNYILGSAHQDLGVAFLVKLRQDVREVIHWLRFSQHNDQSEGEQKQGQVHLDRHKLREIEWDIQTILTSLFRPGVLSLQQITYDKTPASVIEQIAFKEAVHPMQSLNDLRTRLGPGRRCYAFFHPALQGLPLVFVHVALVQKIPESMDDLHQGTQRIVDGSDLESESTCATFYSITNAEPGLAGVDLGNHLIKSVVQVLKNEFPSLETFCTLSPIPNFRRWLEGKISRRENAAGQSENENKFVDDDLITQHDLQKLDYLFSSKEVPPVVSLQQSSNELKPLLLRLAAHYLSVETHHGRPLCPVAKFHIRNGAEMYRLNYLGDTSAKGVRSSCGVMINYRYLLEELEENRVNYERSGDIVVRDGVKSWLVVQC